MASPFHHHGSNDPTHDPQFECAVNHEINTITHMMISISSTVHGIQKFKGGQAIPFFFILEHSKLYFLKYSLAIFLDNI